LGKLEEDKELVEEELVVSCGESQADG
jgi:hypothetical protein